MNEPRCQSDLSGRYLQDWIREMAGYVKSINKHHLLEIGLEGFYGESMPEKKGFNPSTKSELISFLITRYQKLILLPFTSILINGCQAQATQPKWLLWIDRCKPTFKIPTQLSGSHLSWLSLASHLDRQATL